MNTPTHLLIAAALLARKKKPSLSWVAVAGALVPDLSLYLLAGFSLFIQGNSPDYVFGTQYFSDAWQSIFAVDNSFFVWGAAIAIGLYTRKTWLTAFAVGGFAHILCDFPLHHDDGRAHFWPLSDWVFKSPFSYWDVDHHANIIAPIEAGLALVLVAYLISQFKSTRARWLLVVLVAVPMLMISASWLMFEK